MSKKYNKYDVSPEKFVEVWQASEDADEVAQKLAMPKAVVLARASSYRQMGVKLKKLERSLNVDKLNNIIEEINKKNGVETVDTTRTVESIENDPNKLKVIVGDILAEVHDKKKKR